MYERLELKYLGHHSLICSLSSFRDENVRQPRWNNIDGIINRRSHLGNYDIVGRVPR